MSNYIYQNVNLAVISMIAGMQLPQPDNTKLLFDAINGFLVHQHKVLIRTNPDSSAFKMLGAFYVLDTWDAKIIENHVNINEFATKINLYI